MEFEWQGLAVVNSGDRELAEVAIVDYLFLVGKNHDLISLYFIFVLCGSVI